MLGDDAEMPPVGAGLEDLADLPDHESQLVVRVVVVRAEPDAGVRPEVAEDLPPGQLAMDGREVRHVHGHRPAPALRLPGASDLVPGTVGEVDQELRLAQRVLPDPPDADLLDQVVAGRGGVVRRDVRRPGEEPGGTPRVAQLLLEAERLLVSLPAGEGRLEASRSRARRRAT